MRQGGTIVKDSKEVICLAAGDTYGVVMDTAVTAHPARAPYPRTEYSYLVPIRRGGYLERLYDVLNIVECLPDDVEKQKSNISAEQYERLLRYHLIRSKTFGYGDGKQPYRFYILREHAVIRQPFQRRNIQISVKMKLEDIPLM